MARVFPLVPGVELTGTVEESTSPEFTPGQRVLVQGYDLGVDRHGGFAAYARVPADWVVPLPDALTLSHRRHHRPGRLHRPAVTAPPRPSRHDARGRAHPRHRRLRRRRERRRGAAWPTPASRSWRLRARRRSTTTCKQLGATRVVGREFTEDDGRTLGPQLWAGVVDCVGGRALAEALRTVRYGGAVAASGLTGGNELATTVYPFIVRGVALLGIDTVATPIEERRALWRDMADAFPLQHCEEMVNEEIGLDGLTAALDRVLDAAVRGRILVNPALTQ